MKLQFPGLPAFPFNYYNYNEDGKRVLAIESNSSEIDKKNTTRAGQAFLTKKFLFGYFSMRVSFTSKWQLACGFDREMS